MNKATMPVDPGDEIRRIKTEYENIEAESEVDWDPDLPDDVAIGTIWFNPETNDMFVCNGRINSKAVWTKVNDKEDMKVWI